MDKNKNRVEEEDDLSFFDELNEFGRDEIFSDFMSQSPVDFAELEQYTDDEMSSILMQEMDDSVVVHVPPMSPTPSTMELPADFKKPRKKQSESGLQESAVLNPRRSKRIKLRRASATKSENVKRLEEFMLEHKGKSCQVQPRARAAELATLEMKTKDLSDENTALKELHKTMENQIPRRYARNKDIRLGIRWLRMMAPNPATASMPFPFNPGNSADLLPNLQGHEHSVEVPQGFAGASSSTIGGDDTKPWCTANNSRSPDNSSGNNGLAKGSGKPADLAPAD